MIAEINGKYIEDLANWTLGSFDLEFSSFLKGAYWISSNSSFIQYCDSNNGLFSIAPPFVIALPTGR